AEGGGQRRWRVVRHRRPVRARADPLGRQRRGDGGSRARVHAHAVPLRQLSGRGGAVAAAVRAQGGSAPAGAGSDPVVSLRAWLSRVRGADPGQQRSGGQVGQGGGGAGAGTAGRRSLSVLAKRLAGLRQQAGAAPPASPRSKTTDRSVTPRAELLDRTGEQMAPPAALGGQTTGGQVSLPAARRGKTAGEQVAQLRKLLGLRPRAFAPVRSFDRSLEGDEIAPGLRYVEERVPFEGLPERLDLTALKLKVPDLDQIETQRILAFDTETTGLAGGTGTRAFMIGASDWRDGGLRIRQLLMTTMGAEQAMLQEFTR